MYQSIVEELWMRKSGIVEVALGRGIKKAAQLLRRF
jgi:hypothetical protein